MTLENTLSVDDFVAALALQGVVLIDVRRPEEFSEGHIKGARLLPVQEFSEEKIAAQGFSKDTPILLYCRSGGRSEVALGMLTMWGYTNVNHLGGGILAWKTLGKEVEV